MPENNCVPWKSALQEIEKRRIEKNMFPYSLITYYFANAYFGIRQAIELDSIRYAIDQVIAEYGDDEKSRDLQSLLLVGLLSVASTISSAPGHFAQYKREFSVRKSRRIWTKRREKMPWAMFFDRVRYLINERPPLLIKACNGEWQEALKTCISKSQNRTSKITTVYADPPMSDFQYSRFYHVLNTICLYDYPKSLFKGLYRDDRFSSKFSLIGKACIEMENFIFKGFILRLNQLERYLIRSMSLSITTFRPSLRELALARAISIFCNLKPFNVCNSKSSLYVSAISEARILRSWACLSGSIM